MSEQHPQQCDCEFCVNDRAERDRLVARLTAATDVVRQAKAAMVEAEAEIDRLRADLAAERERAERANTLMEAARVQRAAAEQRAVQAEAGAAQLRAALGRCVCPVCNGAKQVFPGVWANGYAPCHYCDGTGLVYAARTALADHAGRELLAAADGLAEQLQDAAEDRHNEDTKGFHTGTLYECQDAICRRDARRLARWSAVRGQG